MKSPDTPEPEMSEEYNLSGGRRGRSAHRYAGGTNVVLLDLGSRTGTRDVAKEPRDSIRVDEALGASVVELRETLTEKW
jgi:hypothetical protein